MIIELDALIRQRNEFKSEGRKVVFSNGCFDILHRGHVEYLQAAKELGDILIIGLNSDASIRRIKGEKRPIVPQEDRAIILSSLSCVDYVIIFDDDTPKKLIEALIPDILIKGSDWAIENIVGGEIVLENGGEVKTITLTKGRATSNVIERILELYLAAE